MSISKRVAEAVEKMARGDTEGSLFQICSALDATAAQLYGKGGGKSYRDFIHENLEIITHAALGFSILNLNLQYDINANRPAGMAPIPPDANGLFSVEQIFYHAVRCCLYHEAKLPSDLTFDEKPIIDVKPEGLVLPASLVYGLIAAVVACPINVGERVNDAYGINVEGVQIPLNKLWGKRDELRALYAAMQPFR